jgi:hypothetical protein
MTLAILDAGAAYHRHAIHGERFRHHFDRVIYAPELQAPDLAGIDALIVPDRTHPAVLRAKRRVLLDHLHRGGTLIVFAETHGEDWLPGVEWSFRPTNFWWWLERGADPGLRVAAPDHPLFAHLGGADAVWHHHGVLHPPEGADRLIVVEDPTVNAPNQDAGCLLYDDRVSAPGRLIVSTLDPFYHHGSFFMPATTRFLDRFLAWTDETFRKRR